MRFRGQITAVLVGLTLCGCHKEPSLVGDWTGEMDYENAKMTTTSHFGADGTLSVVMPRISPDGKMSIVTTMVGSWKRKDDDLVVHVTDASVKATGVPADYEKSLRATFEAQKRTVLAEVNRDPTTHIGWSGDDTLILSTSKSSHEYHRVKLPAK